MQLLFRRLSVATGLVLAAAALAPAQDKAEAKAKAKAPTVPEGTRILKDLAYVPDGGPRRALDLYLPPQGNGPLPLVIWVHGGGWQGGSKDDRGPAFPLLGQGYAVASINYRLSQHAAFPAQIHDCKAAIRYLRSVAKEHNLDPDRFGAWGMSAGGHLVALLGTSGGVKDLEGDLGHVGLSSRVQAVCDVCGPTDLNTALNGAELRTTVAPLLDKLLGGPLDERRDLARAASPLHYVTPDDAPTLILHGDRDPLVPLHQAVSLYDALRAAKVEAELQVTAGAGHDAGIGRPEVERLVRTFFDKHVKARRPAN
jgi:acetyl esterase/lipase